MSLKSLLNRNVTIFSAIILVSFLIRAYNIEKPLIGYFDGPLFATIARNYLRFGYVSTSFGMVDNIMDGNFHYYANHPPMLGIMVSMAFKLLGINTWSGRIVPILFSVGSIVILYIFTKKIWGVEVAEISAFLVAIMPISSYFGKVINYEPVVLFFVLLSIYSFFMVTKWNKKLFLLPLGASIIIGGLVDYPFFYVVPTLLIYSIVTKNKYMMKYSIYVTLLAISVFLLFLYFTKILIGHTDFLFQQGAYRSQMFDYLFTYSFLNTIFNRILNWFTPVLILLSSIWFLISVKEKSSKKNLFVKGALEEEKTILLLSLFFFGILNIIIFSEGAYFHPFWTFYLIPFVSISSAIVINKINIKMIKVLILVVFLFSSLNSLESYNLINDYEGHALGKLINDYSYNDTIFIDDSGTIVRYYADRPSVSIISFSDSYNAKEIISQYNPEFIFYSKDWKNQTIKTNDFENVLNSMGYTNIYIGERKIWKLHQEPLVEVFDDNLIVKTDKNLNFDDNFNNQITLLSFQIDKKKVDSNSFIKITYIWKIITDNDFWIFVHFEDENGKLVFQQNHQLAGYFNLRSNDIVKEEYYVYIPPDIPSNVYKISLGIYNPQTGERLSIKGADTNQLYVGKIEINKIKL